MKNPVLPGHLTQCAAELINSFDTDFPTNATPSDLLRRLEAGETVFLRPTDAAFLRAVVGTAVQDLEDDAPEDVRQLHTLLQTSQ